MKKKILTDNVRPINYCIIAHRNMIRADGRKKVADILNKDNSFMRHRRHMPTAHKSMIAVRTTNLHVASRLFSNERYYRNNISLLTFTLFFPINYGIFL